MYTRAHCYKVALRKSNWFNGWKHGRPEGGGKGGGAHTPLDLGVCKII